VFSTVTCPSVHDTSNSLISKEDRSLRNSQLCVSIFAIALSRLWSGLSKTTPHESGIFWENVSLFPARHRSHPSLYYLSSVDSRGWLADGTPIWVMWWRGILVSFAWTAIASYQSPRDRVPDIQHTILASSGRWASSKSSPFASPSWQCMPPSFASDPFSRATSSQRYRHC